MLQAQAKGVGRADHPTCSLNLFLVSEQALPQHGRQVSNQPGSRFDCHRWTVQDKLSYNHYHHTYRHQADEEPYDT